jgi:hypothetical protein
MATNKKTKSVNLKKDNNITTITDDKTINEVLENIGKKSKNPAKKALINNFINDKSNNDAKKDTKKVYQKKSINNDNDNNGEEKKTFTSSLTKEDINEKLQDYKLVDDISTVPLGTHLRYFIIKDGVKLFRMGGNLKRNLDLPNFIVLVNAVGVEWTVQIKDTIFYKKMSLKEIKDEYDGIIEELHQKIKKYKTKIEEKDKIIIELQEKTKKTK